MEEKWLSVINDNVVTVNNNVAGGEVVEWIQKENSLDE